MNSAASWRWRRPRATGAGLTAALVGGILVGGAPAAPADPVHRAPAVAETWPSDVSGDTMDDPAIWVDPPTRSAP